MKDIFGTERDGNGKKIGTPQGASELKAELYDFCLLCGDKVSQNGWREHMAEHGCILDESPKNDDGKWLLEFKVARVV